MVVLAERFARLDREDRSRVGLFALAALTMIAMALMVMLSDAALTIALAFMVLVATVLDRKFGLPPLGLFVQAGVAVVSWRLVFESGFYWAFNAPFWEFEGTYVAVLVMFAGSRFLMGASGHVKTIAVVGVSFWTLAAVFTSVLIMRLIEIWWPGKDDSHAAVSLVALVWLVSMANQIYRLNTPGISRRLRIVLAILYAVPGFGALFVATFGLNPLMSGRETAFGPYLMDSLFIAYGLPALFFFGFVIWIAGAKKWLRRGGIGFGISYAGLYVALEIRRFWRGDTLAVPGTTDPELYSYTVAMLLASAGLLFYAFYRHSVWLRKLALVGIGLTVAKVFLIDVSGLTGLTRVFSFLVLGLVLAGLAWLDRWFGARDEVEEGKTASD